MASFYPFPSPSTPATVLQTPVSFMNDSYIPYAPMPMPLSPFASSSSPTPVVQQTPVMDDTLLRLANFVHSANFDTARQHQQQLNNHQLFARQQQKSVVIGGQNNNNGDRCRIADSNILTLSRVTMLELVRAQVRSPIVDFLCSVLSDFNQYGHVCSFIANREFKIHNTKTFTELLNLRSRQKPVSTKNCGNYLMKSYLQVARALKSYEDRVVDGHVMLRKVKDKRNQFKFFPDLQ